MYIVSKRSTPLLALGAAAVLLASTTRPTRVGAAASTVRSVGDGLTGTSSDADELVVCAAGYGTYYGAAAAAAIGPAGAVIGPAVAVGAILGGLFYVAPVAQQYMLLPGSEPQYTPSVLDGG